MAVLAPQPPPDTPAAGTTADRADRTAELLSDLAGLPLGVAVFVAIGAETAGSVPAGVGWGLLVAALALVIPGAVTRRLRHGSASVPRGHRLGYMLIMLAAASGAMAVSALGAPPEVPAVAGALVAGIVVGIVVNLRWRVSNHTAGTTMAAVMMLAVFGWPAAPLAAIPVAMSWARVRLGKHTIGETVSGIGLGGVIAAVAFPSLVAAL